MDTMQTLNWLREQCGEAIEQARRGDTLLANHLGANPALAHYFANVHNLRALTPSQWAQNYPHFLREAERIRAEQDHARSQDARLSAIENQLARLLELLSEREI
jgi:hypothetical protein